MECFESFLKVPENHEGGVIFEKNYVFKPYTFKNFLEEQET